MIRVTCSDKVCLCTIFNTLNGVFANTNLFLKEKSMSIILALPAQKLVLNAFTIFTGTTPSNATFNAHVAFIATSGEAAYTSFLNTVAKDIPVATLASNMLTNLGLTSVFTQAEAVAYLNGNLTNLGGAMSSVATATLNYVSNSGFAKDAEMLAAQTAWTNTATNALAYSTATTSTAAGSMTSTAPAAASTTFILTTGVDRFTGTDGEDLFTADNTGAAETASVADTLNGGDGQDALTVFSDGTMASVPTLTSIESILIYDEDTALSLTGSSYASLETVGLTRNDGDSALTVGVGVTTVNLSEMALDDAGANDGMTVTLAAAATSVNLGLNAITVGVNTGDEDVNLVGAALTTVVVNGTGVASSFEQLNVAAANDVTINAAVALTITGVETTGTLGTLTLAGAGAQSLGTIATGFTTVTSTATGATTLVVGADTQVITLGAGDDIATASATDGLVVGDLVAINGGDGSDTLIIGDAADVNTAADAARYTNFETLRLSDSYVASLMAGITAIELTGASTKSYTALTAAQAGSVKVRGDETTATFTLQDATGTADVLSLTMGTGLTTSAATDIVTGVTVTGFETVNIAENGGATASVGAAQTAIIAAFSTPTTLNDINLTGRAVTLSNIATTVAVNIDGSALTGNGATGTAIQGLTANGTAVAGSVITGSAFRDSFTIGAEGSDYTGGAGNDTFTTSVAILAANGVTDGSKAGGDGTDTMVINTTAATMTDNHFIKMSGFEALTLSTGSADIQTGGAFNAAFATGATVTTGTLADTSTFVYAGGLYAQDTTVTIDGTSLLANATGEDVTVTTGAGNDTVTLTGTAWVGQAGDSGTITFNTAAGDDTISYSHGTLLATTTSQNAIITAGTGADLITKVGTNSTTVTSITQFAMAAGDSGTTVATMDQITGFDLGVTTGTIRADTLNFEGTAAVSAFSAHVDSGVIKGHNFATAGVITFDDADTFAAALTINASNLVDVVGYLNTNLAANGTVAFAYDSDANGTADGTMVYHQGSTVATVADDMVFLVGVTGGSVVVQGGTTGADGVVGIL